MSLSGFRYHTITLYTRHGISPHFLDWEAQPSGFKSYNGIESIELPKKFTINSTNLSKLFGYQSHFPLSDHIPLHTFSSILLGTCTITAKTIHAGTPFYFRSVASAGALYPFEIYVFIKGVEALNDGLYHYSVDSHSLHPLRFCTSSYNSPGLTFFLTSIFFRSSWKYRDRAYRYCLLDTGHLLENLLLSLRAHGLSSKASYDFNDSLTNSFLGLDPKREGCLAVCSAADVERQDFVPPTKTWGKLPANVENASQVSPREVEYELVTQMHQASQNLKHVDAEKPAMDNLLGVRKEKALTIHQPTPSPTELLYPECLLARRSRRNFVPKAMTQSQFATILECLSSECLVDRDFCPVSVGALVGNIEGMAPGFYLFDKKSRALHIIKKGNFQREMSHICLDQAWLANAALHVLFISNLKIMDEIKGPRGYRYAMLESGRFGQLIYLLATSMGLGCCGIGAFYDEEAAQLLGLNKESRMLYLVALGPVKRLE